MVVKREVYFGIWRRGGLVVERRTRDLEGPRGPEFEPHDRCVVSLRKALSPSQSTNNTQEEVAPSQHD